MKKLKYILFIFIVFLTSNVFADEFNMNSYTSATKGGTKNRYRATEIYNTGTSNTYSFGTKYNGRISDIETYFSYPFSANMTYRLTYNMNTDDFVNNFGSSYWWDCDHEMTNINATVQSVNYISYRKVTFTFTPTEATTCIRVWLRSKNLSSTAITSITNWQLNNITIYDPEWQNGSSSSSGSQGSSPGSSGTSSSNNTDEIINNATQNTHSIIDNQNTNTQDVINNANSNTQDVINNNNTNTQDVINNNNTNSQNIINNQNDNTNKINDTIDSGLNNKCLNLFDVTKVASCQFANNSPEFGNCNSSIYDTSPSGGYVQYITHDNWNGFHTDYIPVNQYTNYYLSFYNNENSESSTNLVCTKINLYNSQKKFISQSQYCSGAFHVETSVETPYNASYVRISIESETPVEYATIASINFSTSQNYCVFGSTTSKLDDTNNYLKDDSDPTISNSALNDVFGKVHFTDPLSYLLTLPTQLINKIVSMSDTCSPIDLGTLYGVHLTLPCINLETYLGSDLWGILDVILSVGLLSVILKNFYDTISNLLTLGGEKEAKEKFSMPTPMDFLAMILGGDNR